MTDLFRKREKSEEAKYKMDSELRFKAHARRNKLLGLWAAKKMGMRNEEAEAYAQDVIVADFEEPGDDDVVRKVKGDFLDRGISVGDDEVRGEMERSYALAFEQLRSEYPAALASDHDRVGD